MDFNCNRCANLMIDPVRDDPEYACQECFPEGIPDKYARQWMASLPGQCPDCDWTGTLAEQGRHERMECERRKLTCEDCGIRVAQRDHAAHVAKCPSALIDYPCCENRGPRGDLNTHTTRCVFGCGLIVCMDREKHDHAATETHRDVHVSLKRKFRTLKEAEDDLRAKLVRHEPARRTKQLGELPSRFSVNTTLPKMVQYLNDGGSGPSGLDILKKIKEIFEHPTYSKNITGAHVTELLEGLRTQIVDIYVYDDTKKDHTNEGLGVALACLKVPGTRIGKQVGQLVKDMVDTMRADMLFKVRGAYFDVVRALPCSALNAFLPTFLGLMDSHASLASSWDYFKTMSVYMTTQKATIVEHLPRIAEIIKSGRYSESREFLRQVVDADTAALFYKTGLIDYLAAHLTIPGRPQYHHGSALVTLRKISRIDASLLVNVRGLLPANFR